MEEKFVALLKRLASDWRNIALTAALLVIAIMLINFLAGDYSSGKSPVVAVGGHIIRQRDVVGELKRGMGDQLVLKMVNDAVIAAFAQQQGVSVSDADVDTYVEFQRAQLEMQGRDLDEILASQGVTLEQQRDNTRVLGLMVRLVVPDADIEAAVAKFAKDPNSPFVLPQRYRVREFIYNTDTLAKQAYEHFQTPDGLKEGALLSTNGEKSLEPMLVVPGTRSVPADIIAVVKKLKVGEFSKPLPIVYEGKTIPNFRRIVQLVSSLPATKPTVGNSWLAVGQYLMQSEDKFRVKIDQVQSSAINKVDVQFMSKDFTKAYEKYQEMKQKNPDIPGVTTPAPDAPATPPGN